jgi:hypothetical protein
MRHLLIAVLLPCAAMSGSTGGLSGFVTDTDGAPLVGASVVLEGTGLGAVTDAEGAYFVYTVSPGFYSVTARMVGSETVTKDGVRVFADQVTRQDFSLGSAAAGHTVIEVRSERNLVLETVPSTIHVMDFSEMRLMPVPDLMEILVRQPGVVFQGGALHVRGGRAGEVAYLLDGVPVRSPITNSFSAVTPVSALSEASVITGGISAEYGNAMSGVVNMVTRDGGDRLSGELVTRAGDLEEFGFEDVTRNYSEPAENDIYRSGCIDAEATLGGPEPITSVILPALGIEPSWETTFFGTGRIMSSGRDLEDSRGYWENNWQNCVSGSMKVTSRFSATSRLSVMGFYNYRESGWDEWAWSRYDQPAYIEGVPYLGGDPDFAVPVRYQETGGATAALTVMPGERSVLDVRLNQNRFCHWRRIQDPDGGFFGESYSPADWLLMYFPDPRVADSLGFFHSGIHSEPWLESRSTVTNARADLTLRLSSLTEIKTGIEGSCYDIYDYSVHLSDAGSAYVSLWKAYPWSCAGYAQAQLRFGGGMVMSAGLRMDVFDPNCMVYDPAAGGEADASTKQQISPRFGITHPVSERDVFFATYGHYFQMPNLNQLYYGTDYNIAGLYSIVGNPDLDAERTTAYEAGLRHRLSDRASLALSAFYKDVTGLVRTAESYSESYDYFFLYENDDSHGTIRGLEAKLLQLPGGWLSGSASYTYSIAKGRYSTDTESWEYHSGGFMEPTEDSYLDWDQRHTAEAGIVLTVPPSGGSALSRILEGASLSIDWMYGSGFPYSPPAASELPQINTERYPYTTRTDLSLSKSFTAGGLDFKAGVTVYNLFDRDNLARIFDSGHYIDTGEPGGIPGNPGAWAPARHLFARLGVSW